MATSIFQELTSDAEATALSEAISLLEILLLAEYPIGEKQLKLNEHIFTIIHSFHHLSQKINQ